MVAEKGPWTTLRETRLFKGLSLDEISKKTKINKKYLEALENGVVDVFPGEVYLRGFLRSYASFLGLDPAEMVSRYEESGLLKKPKEFIRPKSEVATFLKEEAPVLPRERKGVLKPLLAHLRSGKVKWFVGGGIGFFVLCLVLWIFVALRSIPRVVEEEAVSPPPPPVVDEPIVEEPIEEGPTRLLLEVEAIEDSWVELIGDSGEKRMSLLLRAGENLRFEAEERIKIKTGNAGGLLIKLNDRELGPLGEMGEVVTKTITLDGISE
jgi:transcriptional regulator with XRE-family HTH domain